MQLESNVWVNQVKTVPANSHKAIVAKIVHNLMGPRHITIHATPKLEVQ